jgi:hypothetical protein
MGTEEMCLFRATASYKITGHKDKEDIRDGSEITDINIIKMNHKND